MKNTTGLAWQIKNHFVHIGEGWRMYSRKQHVKKHGFKRFGSKWDEICLNIIKDRFVKDPSRSHFTVSAGHFNEVYVRDFGWCAEPLIRMGYEQEAALTAKYILHVFKKHNCITTTINPSGIPFDFPVSGPDSFAYLMHSLVAIDKATGSCLIKNNKGFLQQQATRFVKDFVDEKTGLVKRNLHVSSVQDNAIRQSSCYDNCMLGMLSQDLKQAGIKTPLEKYDYHYLIKENFWNGSFFKCDLGKHDFLSGDANIFPFWCDIFKDSRSKSDREMLKKALSSITVHKLDSPFPLKFVSEKQRVRLIFESCFANRYELDTHWTQIGAIYIGLLARTNRKKANLLAEKYKKIIEHYGTYPEVLESDGTPYESAFYFCDEGMLWAAMFYEVVNRNKL